MLVAKTVKVPVHYGITTHKLSILDSLTARITYGAWIWSELFREHKLKGSHADRRLFHARVREQAKLSGAITQCCFDTAAWMWWSYREAHKAWRMEAAIARREGDGKWLRKLKMIGNKKAMSAQMGEHVEDPGDTASRMHMAVVRFVGRSVRFVWQQFRCEDSVSLEDSHADTAFWSAALMWKAHGTSLGGLMECSVRWGLHLILPGTLGGWEPLRGLERR
jgi:hypothetical protein